MPKTKSLPRIGQCVYCGEIRELTDDHIPPKNLFAKPRPNDLIEVPSCKVCNGGASKDDEYFRLMLTLRDDTFDHPEVQKVLPTVFRSLTKPNKVGFSQSLFQSIRILDVTTSGGLFLGSRPTYSANLERLDRVAQRIVKGLFYRERGARLPNEYIVSAYSASGLSSLAKSTKDYIIRNIVDPILLETPKTIGNNVFTYRVAFNPNDPKNSIWHFIFYDKVVFLGFTVPLTTDSAG